MAKAYRELETDGVVVTEGRRGTSIAPGVAAGSSAARRAAETYVVDARRLGLGVTDATRLVEQAWSAARP